ncbi:MAG: efflux RND transporter periplasmic adaptor subunit [bacterium]
MHKGLPKYFFGEVLYCVLISIFMMSCGKDAASKKESPAEIKNPVAESELTTITLTEKAEQRLGIETVAAASTSLPHVLTLGGEVIALPGCDATIVAPLTGTVRNARTSRIVSTGTRVSKGQEVLRLLVLPPEKDLISAQEEFAVKEIELKNASEKLKRAEQLIQDRAISEKVLQETQAQFAAARGAMTAAKARMQLFSSSTSDSVEGNLSTLVLVSPFDGVIQRIFVTSGQTIPASTPMFEVAKLNPVWIKVPVYVGDVARIDRKKAATITPMGASSLRQVVLAQPVEGPPLSDASSATSDLFYKVDNTAGHFRIGEKLMITLPLNTSSATLVVPIAAILYDIHGNSWVYVKASTRTYTRRRVEVSYCVQSFAVVSKGITAGDQVVTSGAAEIFGTEFGGGK